MTLKEAITYMIDATTRVEAESSALEERYGIDPELGWDMFSQEAISCAAAPRPERNDAERFLAGQDLHLIRRLEALMYSGRNRTTFEEELEEAEWRSESAEIIALTMMEKCGALRPYLEIGIAQLKERCIDLDDLEPAVPG